MVASGARAQDPGRDTVCHPVAKLAAEANIDARMTGGIALTLEGVQALRFLEFANNVSSRTDYRGDALIIRLYPGTMETGHAMVVLGSHGCVKGEFFQLRPIVFLGTWRAAVDKPGPAI